MNYSGIMIFVKLTNLECLPSHLSLLAKKTQQYFRSRWNKVCGISFKGIYILHGCKTYVQEALWDRRQNVNVLVEVLVMVMAEVMFLDS